MLQNDYDIVQTTQKVRQQCKQYFPYIYPKYIHYDNKMNTEAKHLRTVYLWFSS